MDRLSTKMLLLICLLFSAFSSVNAQPVVLPNRTIDRLRPARELGAYLAARSAHTPVAIYARPEDFSLLQQQDGIDIGKPVGNGYYLIYLRHDRYPAGQIPAGIASWAPQRPEDKISAWWTAPPDSNQYETILIKTLELGLTKDSLRKKLVDAGVRLLPAQPWKDDQIWVGQLPPAAIPALARQSFVTYIQPQVESQTCNLSAIGFTNSEGARQPLNQGGHHLLGTGVVIGVGDNTNPVHIDYIDRVRSFNPQPQLGHGIHTTGTVGGNGIIDEQNKGFAPQCRLIADYFSQIIANAAIYYDNFGMVLTNNSYAALLGSCSHAGVYDLYSQYLDQLAFELPKVLNVFAAANDGYMTCSPFPLGYATVAGSYTTAKNVLTVGNIGKTRAIFNQTTSCGPVKDGRLKPEITAVGTDLVSTFRDNTYRAASGTSMAAPNVTGAAGLLYERFRQLHSGQNPDNALIKALLMNGADDLAIPGPDFRYGFGLMNLGHSLRMLDSNYIFSDQLTTGQTKTVSITIPQQTAAVRIMLYWNDPPATPISAKTLVNDLDLTVSDAANTLYLPLHPNPDPDKVTLPATPRPDHVNNVEQVVLQQPLPGNYQIHVRGFDVPVGPQEYYLVYDLIPEEIALQYPFGGEALAAGDTVFIYWEAPASAQSFSIDCSMDNGDTWSLIASVGADQRSFQWAIPDSIAATDCRIRIRRNGQLAVSGSFSIMGRPHARLLPVAGQCPGSVAFSWPRVPGISRYRIFKKIGANMEVVGTTTDTTYTLTALSPDSVYWFSVASVLHDVTGQRALALHYQPDKGLCTGVNAAGDLALGAILSPSGGRKFTQTEPGSAVPLQVLLRNQDFSAATSYEFSWTVNGQPWQHQAIHQSIPPATGIPVTAGMLNLADTGTYRVTIAVTNLLMTDPVPENDTMTLTIRHLPNPPMDLSEPFLEDFETFPLLQVTGRSVMGVGGSYRWDFQQSKPFGRLRSFVNSGITISGNRSISMDNARNEGDSISQSSRNALTGTFNLATYDVQQDEIRCSFDYILSEQPQFPDENRLWVRGNDTDPWLPVYTFRTDTVNPGGIVHPRAFSLNDLLIAAGQSFSESTQIKFTQRDTSLMASSRFGNGLTLDNVAVFRVRNDVALLSIDTPDHLNCALSDAVQLPVTIRNGVFHSVHDIRVSYRLDDLPVVSALIDSIRAKDTIVYIFPVPMDLSATGTHNLSVWVAAPGDSYPVNDSLMNFKIRNQSIIDTFPYLQNFERGAGGFYAAGTNVSWQYGTPASEKIDHAASGKKAWKTNLKGRYNDLEQSYLYSPCYDLSGLSNPMLSFSLATDLEPPGATVYDQAYVEYTTDGVTWQRLGKATGGYNWYNNQEAAAWTQPDETYWHVATIPLPKIQGSLSLRFVLKSDQAVSYEGIAVDDIHVYNHEYDIFDGRARSAAPPVTLAPNEVKSFMEAGKIALTIFNDDEPLRGLSVQDYGHSLIINADSTQYLLPRSFTLKADPATQKPLKVRFFIPGDAIKSVRADKRCPSCSPAAEIYTMGITQYRDPEGAKENELLSDNTAGAYSYIPPAQIDWVPFEKGYWAEVRLNPFSEIWFNDGGPAGNQPFSKRLFTFNAWHSGQRRVLLAWKSATDAGAIRYAVQRADTAMNFKTIATLPSVHQPHKVYTFIDTPTLSSSVCYYRIQWQRADGQTYYSVIRSLDWSALRGSVRIFPNPIREEQLTLEWFKGNTDALHWQLYDRTGRLIVMGDIEDTGFTGQQAIHLSTAKLASGLYFFKVTNRQQSWGFKVLIP